MCRGDVRKYLKVLQALVQLSVGRVELPLRLGVLVSGLDRLLLVQLSAVEVHVLLQLLVLPWRGSKGFSWGRGAGSRVSRDSSRHAATE